MKFRVIIEAYDDGELVRRCEEVRQDETREGGDVVGEMLAAVHAAMSHGELIDGINCVASMCRNLYSNSEFMPFRRVGNAFDVWTGQCFIDECIKIEVNHENLRFGEVP